MPRSHREQPGRGPGKGCLGSGRGSSWVEAQQLLWLLHIADSRWPSTRLPGAAQAQSHRPTWCASSARLCPADGPVVREDGGGEGSKSNSRNLVI